MTLGVSWCSQLVALGISWDLKQDNNSRNVKKLPLYIFALIGAKFFTSRWKLDQWQPVAYTEWLWSFIGQSKCCFPIYASTVFAVGKASTNVVEESEFSPVSFKDCCSTIRLPAFEKDRSGAENHRRCAEFLTALLDGFQTYEGVTSHVQRFGSLGNALTCAQEVPSSNAGQGTSSSTEHIVIPLRKYLEYPLFF